MLGVFISPRQKVNAFCQIYTAPFYLFCLSSNISPDLLCNSFYKRKIVVFMVNDDAVSANGLLVARLAAQGQLVQFTS